MSAPYGGTIPPTVPTPTTQATVSVPTTTPAATDTGFAFTGGDVLGLGIIGGAALLFGTVCLVLRRWAGRNMPNLYVEGYRP